jgi:hypothetical protein
VAALVGLAFAGTSSITPLPPGFDAAALAGSARASTHLIALPTVSRRQQRRHGQPKPQPKRHTHATPKGPILVVGDSVLLGAAPELRARLGSRLRLDAVVARQARDLIDRLFAYRAAGRLPSRVVVHVGDNGPVYWADWQRLKRALRGVPLVVLLNVRVDRSWQDEVNSELRQQITGWRNATIADWYDASAAPGSVVDGTHVSPQGGWRLAALIARALRWPQLGATTH